MEATICHHREQVTGGDGIEIGECTICHQVRQYNTKDHGEKPVVTKLGRIDGKIVLPAGEKLLLSPEDSADLKEVKKAIVSEPVPQPPPAPPATVTVPPRPRKRRLLIKYFKQNKEAILRDYYTLTNREFLKKWKLSATSWSKLKRLWEVVPKGQQGTSRTLADEPQPKPASQTGLPPFPPFSDNWGEIVQVEWLRTYRALKGKGECSNE